MSTSMRLPQRLAPLLGIAIVILALTYGVMRWLGPDANLVAPISPVSTQQTDPIADKVPDPGEDARTVLPTKPTKPEPTEIGRAHV